MVAALSDTLDIRPSNVLLYSDEIDRAHRSRLRNKIWRQIQPNDLHFKANKKNKQSNQPKWTSLKHFFTDTDRYLDNLR